jgi:hypothetical protein
MPDGVVAYNLSTDKEDIDNFIYNLRWVKSHLRFEHKDGCITYKLPHSERLYLNIPEIHPFFNIGLLGDQLSISTILRQNKKIKPIIDNMREVYDRNK